MQSRHLIVAAAMILSSAACAASTVSTRPHSGEQVQISPPEVRRTEPPSRNATVEELEERGDALRSEKAYLDALDYYRAALAKKPSSPQLFNKAGITELLLHRFRDAAKDFEHAIKLDKEYADAHNNLGVIHYLQKKYGKAVKEYEKAIKARNDSASFYSNLGAAYFSKKEFEKAGMYYSEALKLDPEIFLRSSRNGVSAQMSSPEDRAHFDYVLAKLYAKLGDAEHSLEYLRRAMEEGYKGIGNVFKDSEFAGLRKDERFTELMAARPPAIPE